MHKSLISLLVPILLSACGSVSQRDNYVPRIALEPTPGSIMTQPLGKMPDGWPKKLRAMFRETIESDPDTGAYVTDVLKVPVTRYFQIVRPYVCETLTQPTVLKPAAIRNHRDGYLSGDFVDHIPYYACESATRRRYANNDPDMAGADGVIFDGTETEVGTGLPVPFLTHKVTAHGYAIKFKEHPTREELEQRLKQMPKDRIHLQQYDAALFHVLKTKDTSFLPLLRSVLSRDYRRGITLPLARGTQIAIVRVLAELDPTSQESLGIYTEIFSNTIATGTPEVIVRAAHIIACSQKSEIPEHDLVEKVYQTALAKHATDAHVISAAKILSRFGREDLIQKIIESKGQHEMVLLNLLHGIKSRGGQLDCPVKQNLLTTYHKAVYATH